MELKIAGQIHHLAAAEVADERLALEESQGCFIFADAKDAVRWRGVEFGGRWKTWVIGPLAQIPMIPWPRFNRFHQYRHEAEGAYTALKGAIEVSLVGAPILERPGVGKSPDARIGAVYPQDSDGSGSPLGAIMMDECDDHDFAIHATHKIACVCAGNHDGPRLVSYQPSGPCTVASVIGINDRVDHIVLATGPDGSDGRAFVDGFLADAKRSTDHKPVRIDCMSGVICVFWSRISGRDMLGHHADPAMGLCNDGLVKAGGVSRIPEHIDGFDHRRAGPGAYAFIVNPGKWTGRWFVADDGSEALIFSRDGAASFHPELDCSMPGVVSAAQLGVATPMEALESRAKDYASDAANDFFQDLVGPYMPAALLASFKAWGTEKLWSLAAGCATVAFVGLFIGVILLLAACVGLFKTVLG